MNVLTIGNSFSQDATRYIHQLAENQGILDLYTANLYIGGCPLSLHYSNMKDDSKSYLLEENGFSTERYVSIKDALLMKKWDYISVQQVSQLSVDFDTFEPYLTELCAYIRKLSPKSRLLIHETWSYEQNSEKLLGLGFKTSEEMYEKLHGAYIEAQKSVDAYKIIPSGTLFLNMLNSGIEKIHRDTFHATLGLGRYALGLLWLRALTGIDIFENSFSDFDQEISENEIKIAKKCVMELI